MGIINLIATSNYIIVNKDLIRAIGLEEAIMIGELASEQMYWEQQGKLEDGYFYSTAENIEENTTLTPYRQRKILKSLEEKGIIKTDLKGLPARRYIALNEKVLLSLFENKLSKNFTTVCQKTSQLDVKELDTNNNKRIIIKKSNKENIRKKESTYDSAINEYTQNENLRRTILEYIKMRKFIKKPITDTALKLAFDKLDKLANDDITKIKILEQSVMNSWQGLFPLKEEQQKNKTAQELDEFYERMTRWAQEEEYDKNGIF